MQARVGIRRNTLIDHYSFDFFVFFHIVHRMASGNGNAESASDTDENGHLCSAAYLFFNRELDTCKPLSLEEERYWTGIIERTRNILEALEAEYLGLR